MSTYLDWFKTIAFALNDDEPNHEFTRYPLKNMIAAFNDARCLIYKYRPDLFTEWKTIKLQPGRYQDTRGCCDQILDVVDQTTADGATVRRLTGSRNTLTKIRRHWNKPSCLKTEQAKNSDGGYIVNEAYIDMNMDGRFTVSPPVPCDVDAYVRVKCVSGPCAITEASVATGFDSGCDQAVAAWHYVLARMLTGDRIAQGSNTTMRYHYSMFFNILGIVEKQAEKIESEQEARP